MRSQFLFVQNDIVIDHNEVAIISHYTCGYKLHDAIIIATKDQLPMCAGNARCCLHSNIAFTNT